MATPFRPGATSDLAQAAATLNLRDVPGQAIDSVKRSLLDGIACGRYGSAQEPAKRLANMVVAEGGRADASLWGSSGRVPAAAAALATGPMIHSLGFDDFHSKLHPSSVVLAAGLSVAEREQVNGSQLLTGLVAGYESMIRVALALDTTEAYLRGWRVTGICGPIGAAAVAGRLQDLSTKEMAGAFGFAGNRATGLFAPIADGNITLRLDPGFAAYEGVRAADLARVGVTGSPTILENDFGGLLKMMSPTANPARVSEDLGSVFECASLSQKLIPLPMSLTTAAEAAAQISREVAASDIETILLRTSRAVQAECGHEFTSRGSEAHRVLEAQLSAPFIIANCLIHGAFNLDMLTDRYLQDPRTLALQRSVQVEVDPELDDAYPRLLANEVVVYKTGTPDPITLRVEHPPGSPNRPITYEALAAKAEQLCIRSGLNSAQIHELKELIENLEHLDSLEPLFALLRIRNPTVSQQDQTMSPK